MVIIIASFINNFLPYFSSDSSWTNFISGHRLYALLLAVYSLHGYMTHSVV